MVKFYSLLLRDIRLHRIDKNLYANIRDEFSSYIDIESVFVVMHIINNSRTLSGFVE